MEDSMVLAKSPASLRARAQRGISIDYQMRDARKVLDTRKHKPCVLRFKM